KTDALSKIASTSFVHLSKQVLVEILEEKSIQEKEAVIPYVMVKVNQTTPSRVCDQRNSRGVMQHARGTMISGGQSHTAGILLANDARDAQDMIRLGKVKFLIVAMDYFTKSIKAKSMVTITSNQVKKFVWDNIVCHFGLPGEIVSNNAVIPVEIGMPTYRTTAVDVVHNDEELRLNLDFLEERRERAVIREAKAYNDGSHAVDGGKLGPKWERSYEVTEALGEGAYKLRSMDGTVLPRMWNIANLKKGYL
nr:gypsy retrotransposon integrase-like protein 1 [Tanacetum cinerariifolium]